MSNGGTIEEVNTMMINLTFPGTIAVTPNKYSLFWCNYETKDGVERFDFLIGLG